LHSQPLFLARKANDLVQAIFGWSVTALFGRLPRRSQIMVTGALLVFLAWPVFGRRSSERSTRCCRRVA
jgi:hypothetical protein